MLTGHDCMNLWELRRKQLLGFMMSRLCSRVQLRSILELLHMTCKQATEQRLPTKCLAHVNLSRHSETSGLWDHRKTSRCCGEPWHATAATQHNSPLTEQDGTRCHESLGKKTERQEVCSQIESGSLLCALKHYGCLERQCRLTSFLRPCSGKFGSDVHWFQTALVTRPLCLLRIIPGFDCFPQGHCSAPVKTARVGNLATNECTFRTSLPNS